MRTVVNGDWRVSYRSGPGPGVLLSVFRAPKRWTRIIELEYGEGDGARFSSIEAARAFSLRHGYLRRTDA